MRHFLFVATTRFWCFGARRWSRNDARELYLCQVTDEMDNLSRLVAPSKDNADARSEAKSRKVRSGIFLVLGIGKLHFYHIRPISFLYQ